MFTIWNQLCFKFIVIYGIYTLFFSLLKSGIFLLELLHQLQFLQSRFEWFKIWLTGLVYKYINQEKNSDKTHSRDFFLELLPISFFHSFSRRIDIPPPLPPSYNSKITSESKIVRNIGIRRGLSIGEQNEWRRFCTCRKFV